MEIIILLIAACCFLAYSNGANDNFKGVATLFGSGVANYRNAITWATLCTLAGSIAAIFLAGALLKNFSGKGLVPDSLVQSPEFAISVAVGAGITVFLATRIGMPVSTTHSLVGGLLGSGIMAMGNAFNFTKLGSTFLVPLVVSPAMAAAVSLVLYVVFRKLRIKMGISKKTSLHIGGKVSILAEPVISKNNLLMYGSRPKPAAGGYTELYEGRLLGINSQKLLDFTHYLSAGAVSFARGLNDTPKIVGLLLIVQFLSPSSAMVSVALAMAAGGLVNAKKVGKVVAKKITSMNHGQGFTANLVTSLLVTTASLHGLPVSTTHVSVGAIFGMGAVTKKANTRVVKNILLSWVLTLPAGAICSAIIYWVLLLIS